MSRLFNTILPKAAKLLLSAFLAVLTALVITGNVSGSVKAQAASYAKTIKLKLTDGQDATAELQKALDSAAKAGKKKKQALVSVPKGTYYIGRTLEIGSNTCLKLDKDTVIKKNPNPKDPILYMLRTKPGTKGGYSDTSNITIEGGTWDAEFILYNNNSGGSLFFITHTTNLQIINVTLCNNFGTHLIEMGGAKKVTIKGCELYGFKAVGENTEKEAIQLDVCHSDDILPAGAPFDDTPCADITVTGCEIHDYPRAVGSHMMVEGIYHKGIKITGNDIHDITADAIYGYNYVDTVISDNTFTDVGCAVKIKSDSTVANTKLERLDDVKAMTVNKGKFNIEVKDNTISIRRKETKTDADKGGSIGIYIHGSNEYPMSYITVSDNIVTCNSSAVYLKYIDNATVKNVTVDRYEEATPVAKTGFAEDAIKLLNCESATISGCKISTVTEGLFENGIALRDKSSAQLKDNVINAVDKNGIAIYNSTITGSDNHINDSAENGIRVDKSECTLKNTEIERPDKYGIKVDTGTASFETLKITDPAGYGVYAVSSQLDVKDADINKPGTYGIKVDKTTAAVEKLKISDSASYGIYADSAQLDLKDTNVYNSGGCGIKYAGSTGSIKNVNVIRSGNYGICLDENSSAVIENAVIEEAATEALRIKTSEVTATNGLEITSAGRHGIKVEDSVFTVDAGKISGSSDHAITVNGNSTLTAANLEIGANKGNAVQINAGTVSFEKCTFADNEDTVLQVKSDTTVKNCIFKNNLSNAIQVLGAKATITGNTFKDNCSEMDQGKVVGAFPGADAVIKDNIFSDPSSGWEIFVASTAKTNPVITSAKTAKVSGTTDAAGNSFNAVY